MSPAIEPLFRGTTVLLVIDVQERFRPAIDGFAGLVAGCVRLVRTFRILDAPIIVTEQYPRGLGPTVPEVREALALPSARGALTIEKTAFSACGAPGLLAALREASCGNVLVCGIETHVCVQQSVLDLIAAGHAVQVAVDAIGSRKASDRDVALRKMERAGAVPTTTEMAAFELLRDARHPRFKEVQAIFK